MREAIRGNRSMSARLGRLSRRPALLCERCRARRASTRGSNPCCTLHTCLCRIHFTILPAMWDGAPRLLPTPHSCAAGNAWSWKPTTRSPVVRRSSRHPTGGGERVRLARRQWTHARGWEGTVVSSKYKRACSLPACRAVGTASHATTFQGANPERDVLSTCRVCTHESSALPPGIPAVVLRQRVTRRGCNCLGAVSGAWPTEMRTCEPWV